MPTIPTEPAEPAEQAAKPRSRRPQGRFLYVILGAAVAAITAVIVVPIVLLADGGTQPVRGQVLGGSQAGATVAEAVGGAHGICAGAVAGTQVIVKGPSGTLLATTALKPSGAQAAGQVGVYEFSMSIPAGNGPYTVDLVGVSSVVVSAKDLDHLQLTCG